MGMEVHILTDRDIQYISSQDHSIMLVYGPAKQGKKRIDMVVQSGVMPHYCVRWNNKIEIFETLETAVEYYNTL